MTQLSDNLPPVPVRDGCDVLEPSRRLDVSDSADVVVADVAVQKDPCIIGGVSPQPIGKVLIM